VQRNCPKHVEFLGKNFWEITASVGFIKKQTPNFSPNPVTTQQLPSAAYSNSPLPTTLSVSLPNALTLPPTYRDHKYDEHCRRTF
jgi:hypothetical protein